MPFDLHNDDDMVAQHLTELEDLKNLRHNFDRHFQEAAEFVFPRSSDFTRSHSPGEKRNERIYDAFSMGALNRFAAAMEAGLMPQNSIWHRLTTGDEELDDDREVRSYLEKFNLLLYRRRYRASANFRSQAHELLQSLGVFGNGVMFIPTLRDGSVVYKCCHLGSVWFYEDFHGRPCGVFREVNATTIQAIEEFQEDTPFEIKDAYDQGDYQKKWCFLHVVKKRKDYKRDALNKQRFPFTNTWIWKDGERIVRDTGYYEMPYVVSRYVTSPGETYGRSPAMMVLPDIKMSNEVMRVTIESANLQIDPPMLLPHDDILSEFSLEPGARNHGGVDDQGNQMVRPLVSGSRPELGMQLVDMLHNTIDDAFLGVYFRVLLENPSMTATQAMLIAQQQGQMAQPMIGRQGTEFLDPTIRREAGIAVREGVAPQMPQKLVDYMMAQRQPLTARYESPMVRQAMQDESIAILRTIDQLAVPANLDPSVYRSFDWDKIGPRIAYLNGMPSSLMKTEEQMAREDAQMAQQQQMTSMVEAAPVAARAARDIATAQRESVAAAGGLPVAPTPRDTPRARA